MAAGQWSPQQHFGIGFVESSVVGSPENRTRPALDTHPTVYYIPQQLFWFRPASQTTRRIGQTHCPLVLVFYGGSRLIQREAFGLFSRDVK